MLRRICASLATVLLGSMLLASVGAGPAFADCGSTSEAARLTLANGTVTTWRCSGTYFMDVISTRFQAGGWTGYIVTDGRRRNFCERDLLAQRGNTTQLYLSATRAPWC